MAVQFEHPWFLLLLLFLPVPVFWAWRSDLRLTGRRKSAVFTVRTLVMVLLILALCGMQGVTRTDRQAVVYLVDTSDSMPDRMALTKWIEQADAFKDDKDISGLAVFAEDAAVERMPNETGQEDVSLNSKLNTGYTDIEGGLRLAESLLPENAAGRVVLITDGRENAGDLLKMGRLLAHRGIPVDILPVQDDRQADVAVEEIRVPEQLHQGEAFSLEITLNSTVGTEGELRVYEDNREISSQKVELERGVNRFVLQSAASDPGFHRYRAEFYAGDDRRSANNQASAFSRVSGPPKVLLVSGSEEDAANVSALLEAALIRYDRVQPEMLPQELTGYTAYESIILNNVPATRISEAQMQWMEQAVRDFGTGLVMVGGEDSYGLGGYFQTPVERALPVYMDLRGKRLIPSLAIVLVIDKSGSMDGEKIRLAREAALRTTDLLRPDDQIGLLAFDSEPWWVVEPQKLEDKEDIRKRIRSIPANGGTEVYGAVAEAYDRISRLDAQRKHIILLTDGQSATQQSYESLAAHMKEDNITMSTVAIGQDADTALLQRLAELAGGRYYFTQDQSTVPAIFSREAVMVARTYIVDQPFVPAFVQGPDWFPLFAEGLPQVRAYVATTVKETAETVLASPEPDPLLARWQYGAGKTVAWTSDLSGKWSADWISWGAFPEIFSEWVKWTFPQFSGSPLEFYSETEGGQVRLQLRHPQTDWKGRIRAVISGETGETREVSFTPVRPGEYEAVVPNSGPGAYLARVELYGEEGGELLSDSPEAAWTTGFVIPYSPEYSLDEDREDVLSRLSRLAEMTGGRILSLEQPQQVYAEDVTPRSESRDLSRYLLMAALCLWVLDIAARRLDLPWSRWADRVRSAVFRFGVSRKPIPADTPRTAALERLSQRKKTAGTGQGFAAVPDGDGNTGAIDGMREVEKAGPAPSKAADGASKTSAAKAGTEFRSQDRTESGNNPGTGASRQQSGEKPGDEKPATKNRKKTTAWAVCWPRKTEKGSHVCANPLNWEERVPQTTVR